MLQPNATFIGQIIVFLLLLWFIYSFVVPMIAKPVNERYKRIAEGLAAADAGRKELEQASSRAAELMRQTRERVQEIELQAQRRASEAIETARHTAQSEGARILAAARAEVDSEAARVREQLASEYGALVVQGAEQLLGREIDADTHERLLQGLAEQIARR